MGRLSPHLAGHISCVNVGDIQLVLPVLIPAPHLSLGMQKIEEMCPLQMGLHLFLE